MRASLAMVADMGQAGEEVKNLVHCHHKPTVTVNRKFVTVSFPVTVNFHRKSVTVNQKL
jgi:hypothetical protein